jgi:hypothetical protein
VVDRSASAGTSTSAVMLLSGSIVNVDMLAFSFAACV